MFSFDNRSYSLFEKKFVAGYQFMKVERNGADTVYRIAWKDVVLILENPIFQKWYRDTRKKVVEVQVDGVPVIGHEEKSSAIDQSQPVSPGRNDHPVRIWVEIRISNGLHLSQKNLSYPDLVRMVEQLEGLC